MDQSVSLIAPNPSTLGIEKTNSNQLTTRPSEEFSERFMRPEAERRANASDASSPRDSGVAHTRAADADRSGGNHVPGVGDRGGKRAGARSNQQPAGAQAANTHHAGTAETTRNAPNNHASGASNMAGEAVHGAAVSEGGAKTTREGPDANGATEAPVAGLATAPMSAIGADGSGLTGAVLAKKASANGTVIGERPGADRAGVRAEASVEGRASEGSVAAAMATALTMDAATVAGVAVSADAAAGARGVLQGGGAGTSAEAQISSNRRATGALSEMAGRRAVSESAGISLSETVGEEGLSGEAFELRGHADARQPDSGARFGLGEGLQRSFGNGDTPSGTIEIMDFKRLWTDAAQAENDKGAAMLARAGDSALAAGMAVLSGRDGGLVYAAGQAGLIATPLRLNAHFQEGLMQRFQFMLGTEVQQARVIIDPPQLGPLDLRVAIQGGEAQVQMTAQQAATRDLLEQSLPRLREMFAEAGLQLTDADIRQGHQGAHNGADDARSAGTAGVFGQEGDAVGEDPALPVVVRQVEGYGLLDVYA